MTNAMYEFFVPLKIIRRMLSEVAGLPVSFWT